MEKDERLPVMLVDDDPVSVLVTRVALEESRYFTIPYIFTNAAEALQFIRLQCEGLVNEVRSCLPKALLIDINMPDINGFEFIEQLLVICPEVRDKSTLCTLSTSTHPEDKQRALSLGVDCYLNKPLDEQDFRQIIRSIINKAINSSY